MFSQQTKINAINFTIDQLNLLEIAVDTYLADLYVIRQVAIDKHDEMVNLDEVSHRIKQLNKTRIQIIETFGEVLT